MSRRKVLTPAFHFKVLDQFIEVFDRNSNILVEILGKCQETDAVDIYPLITMAALDIICGKWVEFSLSLRLKFIYSHQLFRRNIHGRFSELSTEFRIKVLPGSEVVSQLKF